MTAVNFPRNLLPVGSWHMWLAGTEESGGAALAGPGQVADWAAGGWWIGAIEDVPIHTPDQHRTWRAILMAASGGHDVIMPVVDDPQRPMGDRIPAGPIPFDDGALMSDGSGFGQSVLSFEIAAPALEGDVVVLIRRIEGEALRGGEFFTLVHPKARDRCYGIQSLTDLGDDIVSAVIKPPLREDLDGAETADFEDLRTTVRIISAPRESWLKVTPPFTATGRMTFAESFGYLDPEAEEA